MGMLSDEERLMGKPFSELLTVHSGKQAWPTPVQGRIQSMNINLFYLLQNIFSTEAAAAKYFNVIFIG